MNLTYPRAVTGIVVLSLLALTVVFAGPAAAQTDGPPVCAGNASDFAGGNGTAGAPYEIATVGQLQCVGDPAHLNASYVLTEDVDASATASWHNGSGFEPIGNNIDPFTGTFDGQGFAVSELVIDRSDEDFVGVFGSIVSGGEVTDVGVENATITGDTQVGGLVGLNDDGTVSETYATGSVSGVNNVGGLVGGNEIGTVSESYATGTVSGDNNVGGLGGYNVEGGTVSGSYATGTVSGTGVVVGGLVGFNAGDVSESYATGNVSGNEDVGGLVGNNHGTVSESYWDTVTSGQSTSEGGTGLTTAEMTGAAAFDHMAGLNVPGTFVLNESYPHLRFQDDLGGDGSAANPYEIRDVYHLQSTAGDLSASYVLAEDVDAAATTSWHTGSGFEPIGNPSDPFTGTFDGQKFTVSGLIIDRSDTDNVGLFGAVGSGGLVTDVGVEDASIDGDTQVGGLVGTNRLGTVSESYATGNVSGDSDVGGLVGWNDFGTVNGSYATGAVSGSGERVGGLVGHNFGGTVSGSYATGTVSGSDDVGGLVGDIDDGTLSGSYATGSVSGTSSVGGLVGKNFESTVSESYATGSVSGTDIVGGLVGLNDGDVSESYATGAVSGTGNFVGGLVGDINDGTVSGSYATGNVSGDDNVGGLVGNIFDGTVSASYWDTNTSGQSTSAGGTGLTTGQMTGAPAESNMTGFDFDDPWTLTDEYPHLQWEVENLTLALDDTDLEEGDTTDAMVTLHLADDSTVTASSVANYTSDDVSVATVTNGTVTAIGTGDATLTAAHSGLADAASLTVESKDSGSGSAPRLDPAAFELSDLTVDTDSILTGESVTVTATVTNVGERSGTHQVTLGLDGTGVRVTYVTLDGGAAETVTLTHTFDVAGEYALTLDGQPVTTLTVVDPTPTPSPTASLPTTSAAPPGTNPNPTTSESPAVSPAESPGQPGFGIVVAVLGLLAAVLLGVRRRS